MSAHTTTEISDNIILQLESALSQSIPIFPKAFIRVLAKVLSGVFILLYKYYGYMLLQMFVSTADIKYTEINGKRISPLIELGRLVGAGDPAPAVQADLLITFSVTLQTGYLPSGSQLINSNNGVTYLTLTSVALDAATKQVTIRATSDQTGLLGAGSIGNLVAGDEVSFANPLSNVSRVAIVDSQIVTGVDGESTEDYRQRVSESFKRRPQGGAPSDYRLWGLESAGIIKIYPYKSLVPGVITVYAEATEASSGSADGIPTSAQLLDVHDKIQYASDGLASRRPIGSYVEVYSIYRTPFDVEIDGISVDNEGQVQTDITSAVEEYFFNLEPYIVGLSVPPRKDSVSISSLGGVVSDIVSAANGTFSSIKIYIDAVETQLYILQRGEKAKLGTISFA